MYKPVLTIFYQYNPWESTIGGIQTIINNFVKYSPDNFRVRLVGTSIDSTQPRGQWQDVELDGKAFQFLPILTLKNDNVRGIIPTTLKYTTALLGRHISSDFMHFHRIEPTLVAQHWPGEKALFIHNDIQQQLDSNDDANTILWRKFPKAYFWLERSLIEQFNQVLSCNSNSAELYRQRYPAIADRVRLIKNTVDTAIFYPLNSEARKAKRMALAHQLGLAEETQFILFAGRLHPQKDPLLLVRSIAALEYANAHLLIAGDGELAQQVHVEIEHLGLSHRVTLLGTLAMTEVAELHRVASAFVLTSAYEGLPLVVLEALACGTPVVTTHCGETPRLLTADSGVVCSQRNPKAIAEALQQVLLHPEHYPAQACLQVAHPYSARTVIHEIYDDMLLRWEKQRSTH
jgi:glycosyltransferase involved in cell wall biosynthesis